ncbi:16S rRNA (guanine(966)-N(2))-methyltransferase RsmD [bacterium]|nr:16S rRNA (guanine(966)-N(2))-methyltransferase RsmD [bacterium]
MRIIAGQYKGKTVVLNEGLKSRPITGKILKAVFDIISERLGDSIFLDLFSGSGIIGIEALSRGARKVTFVEIVGKAVKNIIENLDRVGANKIDGRNKFENVEILNRDVFRTVKKLKSGEEIIDIVFCDPPFHMGFIDRCLEILDQNAPYFLHPESVIIIRAYSKEKINFELQNLVNVRVAKYGKNNVMFYQLKR